MKEFAGLYVALDQTNKTNDKIAELVKYFQSANESDAAWAIYFLSGRKPRQVVPTAKLREIAREIAQVPEWLFSESYDAVGDLAETIALLLPDANAEGSELSLTYWIENRILPLKELPEANQREAVAQAWHELNSDERFVWNKIVTGGFRVGVSQLLVVRALSQVAGIESEVISHRLMGNWLPNAEFYQNLIEADSATSDLSRPYPFSLAYQVDFPVENLGETFEWQAEWKWDGIRAELIKRGGESFLWSRGEDLVSERFPEIIEASRNLPDGTVLDGEILAWKDGEVLPFADLQKRIGRKTIGKKLLEEVPVVLLCYDLMESNGEDIRKLELIERRAKLDEVIANLPDKSPKTISSSPVIESESWQNLTEIRLESRARNVEGLMLKRKNSIYKVGRVRGDWWKWKIEPLTIDAVMIYAQRGTGKRASLYTDYTFAVWKEGELVPFAKAYSGLTDKEIRKVDKFVRENTVESFGPVRSVAPQLVFELAFEGIQRSARHKSGIAVRFPRILRWRDDKTPKDADSIETIYEMLDEKK